MNFITLKTIGVLILASLIAFSAVALKPRIQTFSHILKNDNNGNPTAKFTFSPSYPTIDENVIFNASESTDKDGYIIIYSWRYTTEGKTHFPIHMGYGILLTYSWDGPGVYNVTLTVTDNENKTDSVGAQVPVVVNGPPRMPIKPFGRNSGRVGRKYTYSTHTSDPNGDQIKYGWNWTSKVDGKELTVDEWTNLCESGKIIETSHIWLKKGSYEIRVLAMDEHGSMSSWSDPLPITMFKNKNLVVYEHFIIIVEKFSKY